MVKIFDRFEKARLAASTSLFGLPVFSNRRMSLKEA
jgi:hypothetical protein